MNIKTFVIFKCISARSAAQIIIGLCNSSANYLVRSKASTSQTKSKGQWFEKISSLIELLTDFLSKTI